MLIECRYIHWLADSPGYDSALKAEVRIFNPLFKSPNPLTNPEGFLADINPKSEEIFSDALLDPGFLEIKQRAPWPANLADSGKITNGPEAVRFQALRLAYFCEDKESTPDRIILNRIVALKEDPGKS